MSLLFKNFMIIGKNILATSNYFKFSTKVFTCSQVANKKVIFRLWASTEIYLELSDTSKIKTEFVIKNI